MNYYDSVHVQFSQPKEQGISLTNMLYNLGDKLSKLSSNYRGKTYTIQVNLQNQMELTNTSSNDNQSYSVLKKVCASVGCALKRIAAYFNREIEARHLLVQAHDKTNTASNADKIEHYQGIILGKPSKKIGSVELEGKEPFGPFLCCQICLYACCPHD